MKRTEMLDCVSVFFYVKITMLFMKRLSDLKGETLWTLLRRLQS
nr:MAG TPA: hypothetical protein [Caudoviricetes sp.]